jgi:hypothetical protein
MDEINNKLNTLSQIWTEKKNSTNRLLIEELNYVGNTIVSN